MVVMQIVGLVGGGSSEFDGQFLKEYDPDREGISPGGLPMLAHVVTTLDPDDALTWEKGSEALEEWRRQSTVWPTRPLVGGENRPLTAFTVEVMPLERARGR